MVNVGSPSLLSRSELKIQSLPSSRANDPHLQLTLPPLPAAHCHWLLVFVLSHELHALSPRNESQHFAFNIVIAAAAVWLPQRHTSQSVDLPTCILHLIVLILNIQIGPTYPSMSCLAGLFSPERSSVVVLSFYNEPSMNQILL